MAWTNAFDLGECTVTLADRTSGDAVQLYSGVLGKGDSTTGESSAGDAYTLSVDDAGVVTLEFADNNTFGDAYEILVALSTGNASDARISGLASDALAVNVASARGQINAQATTEDVDYLPYTIHGTGEDQATFAPDPLDMSALTGTRELVGAYVETQGI